MKARWLRRSLFALAAVALLVAGLLALAGTESALRWTARQATQRSSGALELDGVQGSLYGPLTIGRLQLAAPGQRITIHGLRLDWMPRGLLRRLIDVTELRAERIEVVATELTEPAPPAAEPGPPPESFALPFEYRLASVTVGSIAIGAAPPIEDLRASAHYDGTTHVVKLDNVTSAWGAARAQASVASRAPFAVEATASFDGHLQQRPVSLEAAVRGALRALDLAVDVRTPAGRAQLRATADAFAEQPLRQAKLEVHDVDPSLWDPALPQARLGVLLSAQAAAGAPLRGSLRLDNETPRAADRGGIPLHALAVDLAGDAQAMQFEGIRVDFGAGGALQGSGQWRDSALRFDLRADALDLQALVAGLRSTRLGGPLQVVVGAQRVQVKTELRDRQLQIVLDALQADGRVRIDALQLRAGGATLTGAGTLALAEPREFSGRLQLTRFDPARFADVPPANINATVEAAGHLLPRLQARVDLNIRDSAFRGAPLAGEAAVLVEDNRLGESRMSLRLGPNRLLANGRFGAPGDTLRLSLDAPRLASLGPPFGGVLRGDGVVRGTFEAPAVDATLQATQLSLPAGIDVQRLKLVLRGAVTAGDFTAPQAQVELSGADLRIGPRQLRRIEANARLDGGIDGRVQVTVALDGFRSPEVDLDQVRVSAAGTRGRHTIEIAAAGGDLDLQARFAGGLSGEFWRGRILSLASGGAYPATLRGEAPLAVSAQVLRLEDFRLALGDGSADIALVERDGARLRTRGRITRLPTAYFNALLPQMRSTLTLSGGWDLQVAERITGTLQIQRDVGDLVVATAREPLPLRLRQLEIDAAIAPDAAQELHARFAAAGEQLGTVSGNLRLPAFLLDPRTAASRADFNRPFAVDLSLSLPALDALAALLPPEADLSGAATLALTGSGSLAVPKLHADLQVSSLGFRTGEKRLDLGRARVRIDGETVPRGARTAATAQLQVEVAAADAQPLVDLEAKLATEYARDGSTFVLPDSAPLDGQLVARRVALKRIADLFAPALDVDGTVRVEAGASGTLGRPEVLASIEGDALQALLAGGLLQVRDGHVRLRANGGLDRGRGVGTVAVTLEARAAPFGKLSGNLRTDLAQHEGAWSLPGSAPVMLALDAEAPSLAWAGALIGPGALVDGSAVVEVRADGTVKEPGLRGELHARELKLVEASSGVDLAQGRIDASLRGDTLTLDELRLRGGDGELTAKGRMKIIGNREGRIDVRADRLRVLNRPDRLLVATGSASLSASGDRLAIAGDFKADQAIIELPDAGAPRLGDDVVIVGAPPAEKPTPAPVALDVGVDLGERFFVKGGGLDAQLGGSLRLVADAGETPRAVGTVQVEQGAFSAFGQKLTLQRARLVFSGPLDNPQLDIRAVRPGGAVEAGVAVTGTASTPRAELFSTPVVPDTEKMAWLVLGHGLEGSSNQEFDTLQLATGFLLGQGESSTLQARMAEATGLDDVGVRGGSGAGASGAALTVGKRLSDRLALTYERGLGNATNLIKLTYDLTGRWKLQTQSGSEDAIDLFYKLSFD